MINQFALSLSTMCALSLPPCALSLSKGAVKAANTGPQRAFARNVCSSGPAVEEPDLPSLTKTATARSP
jgi:hypothetical protein